jgi:ribosome-binding ATPase YchF (GTP1/OBG family)
MMVGIVGKPNTGKSTFFSAATLAPAEIANYPFTTIKPNRGIGYVRAPCACREFNVKDNPKNSICMDGIRLIPVELIDCAGLVPGAWQGRGLGNQFLDEIRKADALIHIVDASGGTDAEGRICKLGERDPVEDVHFLEVEITLWMANILKRDWQKLTRTVESEKEDLLKLLEERLSGLAIGKAHVFEAIHASGLNVEKPHLWSEEDFLRFVDKLRSISKPMLIAANKVDLPCAEDNLERLKNRKQLIVPCCAEAELALRRSAEMRLTDYRPGDCNFNIINPQGVTPVQKKALEAIKERILATFGTTGVQDAINMAYFKLLNGIVVYPIEDIEHLSDHEGRVLPDAYIVPYGTTAHQLAYRIHSELGEGFIYGVEAHEKKRVGEDYVLKNGDVISIVSARKRA